MFVNNLNRFTSSFAANFKFYKNISEQYTDHTILESVNQLLPEKFLKSSLDHQSLPPLLHWFKNDLMKWMPKELQCSSCHMRMRVQVKEGDSVGINLYNLHRIQKYGN